MVDETINDGKKKRASNLYLSSRLHLCNKFLGVGVFGVVCASPCVCTRDTVMCSASTNVFVTLLRDDLCVCVFSAGADMQGIRKLVGVNEEIIMCEARLM